VAASAAVVQDHGMRIFTCSACRQMVYFENVVCTNCGHTLAFIPEHGIVSALERAEPSSEPPTHTTVYVALADGLKRARYRMCKNGVEHAVCNWLVPESEPSELCRACALNSTIPNLDKPEALPAWDKLERAKRRLLYTLMELALPIEGREERPEKGLAFAFMADGDDGQEKVFTGHADGLITINIAEADDPFREKVRKDMGEAYRTLLGHFRHEVGHYYWDRLINETPWIERFRKLFGDERVDYAESVKRHYDEGAPPDWQNRFVSAYATMHAWEDWAETWAHYLHMVDTLGSARAYGVSLRPKPEGRAAEPAVSARKLDFDDFDDLLSGWIPLTLALNGMNRSMGFPDPYPFILSEQAILKLRFVHEVIENWNASPRVLESALAKWPEAEPAPPPPPPPAAPAPASDGSANNVAPATAPAAPAPANPVSDASAPAPAPVASPAPK
jgi:hypothetical protein